MSHNYSGGLASPIEQQIFLEEKRYRVSLAAGDAMKVSRDIRTAINKLKADLYEERQQNKHGGGDNGNSKHPFSN